MAYLRKTALSGFRACASGVAAIEMAVVVPAMLTVYFGIVDLTNAISASRRVTMTASTMADLVTQSGSPTTSRAELQGFLQAAGSIIQPFSANGLAVEIYGFRETNDVPAQIWRQTNGVSCPDSAPPVDLDRVRLLASDSNDVIVARVCYTVAPIVGQVVQANLNLSDQITLRPRNTARIDCPDCT